MTNYKNSLFLLLSIQLSAFCWGNNFTAQESIYFNQSVLYAVKIIETTHKFTLGLINYEELTINLHFFMRYFYRSLNALEATMHPDEFKTMRQNFYNLNIRTLKESIELLVNNNSIDDTTYHILQKIIDH